MATHKPVGLGTSVAIASASATSSSAISVQSDTLRVVAVSSGTFVAIGSFTGAVGSARLERFRSTKFVIKGGIVFSISVIVLSVLPTFTTYMIWLPICGVSALTTLVSANSIVQTSSDPAIRGRVMGLYLLIFMGGTPFGSPFIGLMSELIGIRPTIAICGVVSLSTSLLVWFVFKNRVIPPADISVAAVLKRVDRNQN